MSIEHSFYPWHRGPGQDRDTIPIDSAESMKQDRPRWRLTTMHEPMRQIAFAAVRTGAMVAIALFLILGILPAILAVQAAST